MPKLSEVIINKFPFDATEGQKLLLTKLEEFIFRKDVEKSTFLIKGFAGTGKTSLISTLVNVLPLFNMKFILLAPTGRAAKVISNYSRKPAFTIHKKIYKPEIEADTGYASFVRQKNYHKNTIFMIDEASMIDERQEFAKKGLLNDLIDYVFENESNRMILIGDTAQLPPVGQSESLALNESYLESQYGLQLEACQLTQVTRQKEGSGVLYNATYLRNILSTDTKTIHFTTKGLNDVFRMQSEKLEDGLRYAYDKFGVENTIVVCRSNKTCFAYNQLIRRNLLFKEEMIEAGDLLMIVKNNYFYNELPAGFLANGDFVEIMKVVNFEEKYDISYARLVIRMIDYPDYEPFEVLILLDSMFSSNLALPDDTEKRLLNAKKTEFDNNIEEIKKDQYMNALQVKFAYALTCHKSQGGQWDAVFVDQGYIKDDLVSNDYIRWLYTAITRSTNELYLVNFHQNFFN